MVPVSMLRDALNCSAHVYDKKRLLVEKHSQSVSMDVGQKKAYLNGDEVDISSALKEVRGQLVVSLEDLSNLLGYSCSFDIASNTITASDKDTAAIVPASYDLRERDRVSTIYNQGSYGTCWAFAATSALESSHAEPEEKLNFSVRYEYHPRGQWPPRNSSAPGRPDPRLPPTRLRRHVVHDAVHRFHRGFLMGNFCMLICTG